MPLAAEGAAAHAHAKRLAEKIHSLA